MSSILRPTITRRVSKQLAAAVAGPSVRAFHSPYTALDNSPITASSSSTSTSDIYPSSHYDKDYDTSPESFDFLKGRRTYVVSEPDANFQHYKVPAGAYPTSSPYIQFARTEAPSYSRADLSSTAADLLAHPFTTRAAPQNPSGVGASSAIRHGIAPGAMGRRGGSHDGAAMADKAGTTPGRGRLGDRNPQPDGPAAAKFSKAGNENAWKMRI